MGQPLPSSSHRARPIGIFDSGVGGLTVVRQVHLALPAEDIIYLGDTARVPYGTKSPRTIVRFACEDAAFLIQKNVKALIVACNSASASALPALEKHFQVPIFGVIQPGIAAALELTRSHRIGVIATAATIRSGAYERGLRARCRSARVFGRACPLLVPLVEEGWTDHRVTREVLREYLAPLRRERIDTLILGCTHYPLLKSAIRALLGDGVALVDSAATCARFVRDHLGQSNLLCENRRRAGVIRPFVTDEPHRFGELARRFLAMPCQPARKVDLAAF
ncbi:MAG: glutamate racemase [Verrucomicrobiota bacterium]|jgi:glutamate racemase